MKLRKPVNSGVFLFGFFFVSLSASAILEYIRGSYIGLSANLSAERVPLERARYTRKGVARQESRARRKRARHIHARTHRRIRSGHAESPCRTSLAGRKLNFLAGVDRSITKFAYASFPPVSWLLAARAVARSLQRPSCTPPSPPSSSSPSLPVLLSFLQRRRARNVPNVKRLSCPCVLKVPAEPRARSHL